VTRYIECAGNGRSFYQTFLNKPAQGGQWKLGGWGVAEWTGVALAEILDRAKVKKSAVEVLPIGLDKPRVRRPIPLSKALEDDTMVVYAMNGDVLPIDHGFPARLLVPGWVGVNNVKWLGTLAVTTQPNWVDWNTGLYVMIGPDYQTQPPAKGPPVTQQVMKSAIALPWPASLKAGPQKITGYAWSPVGKIGKVEVSADGGNTWMATTLLDPNVERAGVRWQLDYTAKAGDTSLMPRATDDHGNVQPSIAQQKWNQQGYLFGAAVPHPITVS
jgi:DMSO/TMAO reductase YedYZ molybdopterin-dependent catalytic subunit